MSERLASSGRIGALELENRFIQSPLHTMLADARGHVTPELVAYYRERALGGAALVISEYAFVDQHASRANNAQISVADNACIPSLARLAEAIHHAGALAGMQLSHAGRQRFLGTAPIVGASSVPWEALRLLGAPDPEELTAEAIGEIVAAFGRAAWRVREAGFDMVELHAGHGYLVGQFLSPLTNQRDDEYGGSLGARQWFLQDVVRSMRHGAGEDFVLTVRLSSAEYQVGGIELEETVATAQMLEAEDVAAIDISAGNHHTMDIQVQPTYMPLASNAPAASEVRAAIGIPVSTVGSIRDPALAEEVLRKGQADFIRLGRPLLADPEYPRKALSGRSDEVRPCIRCNECLDRALARSRPVRCAVNFRCGRESWIPRAMPATAALHVVVVGGGPAGLEAASVAAEAGHAVTLFERDELGGALGTIARSDFKSDLLRYRDYLVSRARSLVEIRTVAAEATALRELDPDVVILATGARPSLRSDGGAEPTLDLRAALADPDTAGKNVVVEGTGQFAAEVAWFLAERGRRVTIAGPGEGLAGDVGPHTSIPLLAKLDELGVERWLGCGRVERSGGTASASLSDGRTFEAPCDTLVTSAYEPLDEVVAEIAAGPWQTATIGDCKEPRRIYDAVEEANVAVRRL